MGSSIASFIIIMMGISASVAICFVTLPRKFSISICGLWAGIITLSLFTHLWLVVLAVIMGGFLIKDQPYENKVIYFIGLLPCLPLNPYTIPFPGLASLWALTFPRLFVLVLLLPAFLYYLGRALDGKDRLHPTDIFFILFFLLTAVLAVRSNSATNMVRIFLNTFIEYLIPYFVISRFIISPGVLNWVFSALLVSAVILSILSSLESVFHWRFFADVMRNLGLEYSQLTLVPYTRGGVTRGSGGAMFNPLGFAHFISLALVTLLFYYQKKILKWFPAGVLAGVFGLALFLTGSRGGQLVVIIGVYMLFYFNSQGFLKMLLAVTAVGSVGLFGVYFAAVGWEGIDSEGSFLYRWELILNSMNAIKSNFILGSHAYENDPGLQQSRQGQGIIDIVNAYLRIILTYGIVGLFLYLMIYFSALKALAQKVVGYQFDHKHLLITQLVMSMVFIVTCSLTSFIPWYIMIQMAMCRAYCRFPYKPPKSTTA